MKVLAIDQGTTSTRAVVFDGAMHPVAHAQAEFAQHFPRSGWVEHDPLEIWARTQAVVQGAMQKACLTASDLALLAGHSAHHRWFGRLSTQPGIFIGAICALADRPCGCCGAKR